MFLGESNKYLVKPVPGRWSVNYDDPLASNILTPAKTDKNGTIAYTDLSFSVSGNLGGASAIYGIQYKCGAALSAEIDYTVRSKVASLTLMQAVSLYIQSSKTNSYDFSNVLFISDSNGNGIQGKFIDKIEVTYSII